MTLKVLKFTCMTDPNNVQALYCPCFDIRLTEKRLRVMTSNFCSQEKLM